MCVCVLYIILYCAILNVDQKPGIHEHFTIIRAKESTLVVTLRNTEAIIVFIGTLTKLYAGCMPLVEWCVLYIAVCNIQGVL